MQPSTKKGWADVAELIEKVSKKGPRLDFETLQLVVDNDSKNRFAFKDDKTRLAPARDIQ